MPWTLAAGDVVLAPGSLPHRRPYADGDEAHQHAERALDGLDDPHRGDAAADARTSWRMSERMPPHERAKRFISEKHAPSAGEASGDAVVAREVRASLLFMQSSTPKHRP